LIDERNKEVAFGIFETLFIDAEIERTDQVRQLRTIIFEADCESLRMSVGREESVVNELIVVCDVETAILSVTVDIIRINGVTTFLKGQIHSVLHDGAKGGGVLELGDIQPGFTSPAGEVFTDD